MQKAKIESAKTICWSSITIVLKNYLERVPMETDLAKTAVLQVLAQPAAAASLEPIGNARSRTPLQSSCSRQQLEYLKLMGQMAHTALSALRLCSDL